MDLFGAWSNPQRMSEATAQKGAEANTVAAWRHNKPLGLFIVLISYVLCTAAGIWAVRASGVTELFWQFAVADAVATAVIFAFSMVFRNSSFYDPYWSVKPMVVVVWLSAFAPEGALADPLRVRLVTTLMLLYGARLTWNWMRGWSGLDHEDWRYVDLANKTGAFWPLVSFSGVHFFPTVLVYLGCLPLFDALLHGADVPFGLLDLLAGLVLLGGITLEALADHQLRRFRLSKPPREKILETGLWRYSRHPNYFGEMLVWWGAALFGMTVAVEWYTFAGALAISLLFVFISTPMIDKRMLARRPGYAERMKRVSGILPWPPKKA
jgi:steroid 5-alpha reductase family enzyme